MYLLLVIVVWILFAYKFIDWRQWHKQYPTILFFVVINFVYNHLYFNHTLWAFRGITAEWLNHSIINLAFSFFICPMALIIYLQRYPFHAARRARIIYFSVWVAFFTVIQALFAHKGMYVYDNGWNSWHNIWLNIILFSILRIHYRYPVAALILSAPIALIFYLLFPVPLETLK
ncbi:hypothetical protein GJU40_09335 [Bacillus lacus]|uniref:Uncharacterized protein n=1 Tax=Metabacillus lacus TaxID=1983721 RepID=A0A7X2LZV0_9BACI|nr:CBO0543 family protein [Metabacillus lacus]MRX72352.1 hypothetical protein [Metabacillus lacus]